MHDAGCRMQDAWCRYNGCPFCRLATLKFYYYAEAAYAEPRTLLSTIENVEARHLFELGRKKGTDFIG